MAREHKVPGPDHPITIEPVSSRIMVRAAGKIVADTTSALALTEASYPAVFYVPRSDIDEALLRRTETSSYCPYKGDCSYFAVEAPDGDIEDAAWSYEKPFEAVASIGDFLAFYPQRVEITVEDAPQKG